MKKRYDTPKSLNTGGFFRHRGAALCLMAGVLILTGTVPQNTHSRTALAATENDTLAAEIIYREDPHISIGDVQTAWEDGVKVVSYGTKISFGKPEGLKYQRKMEGVRAVSYYYSGTPHGAYGMPCEFGTAAVDKDLIPLGSLLYIEGYGYAIANDVGTSIKGKTVDLYMEKYEQCLIWGARRTTVYVIETPLS